MDEASLEAAFAQACDLAGAAREAFLTALAAETPDIAASVRRLLEQDAALPVDFLGGEAQGPADGSPGPDIPDRIGPYRVTGLVGTGGMGTVYAAEQINPKRRVAIKIARHGSISTSSLSRFRREAEALAQLQHPGIAHIYESGVADLRGVKLPYFAMELIDGLPIDRHAEEHGLTPPQRLQLIARVCDAVQHAHQRGIIHRDIKPSNVLVVAADSSGTHASSGSRTVVDAIGQPKILDFGVARFLDTEAHATLRTTTGQIVGTLAYMSPEQIEGDPALHDTRCDVYALGVLMYQLLSGRLPHDVGGLSIVEASRRVREDDPTRLGALDPRLRGDAETIAAKAMAKERDRRYAAAGALAEDIRRMLHAEPITARPASTVYQLRKFASRNRVLVGGAGATVLALVAGLISTIILLRTVAAERDAALQAQSRTGRVADFQASLFNGIDLEAMGLGVVNEIHDELHARSDQDAAADLEAIVERINPTNVARDVIRLYVLDRAVALLDGGYTDDPMTEAELRIATALMYRRLYARDLQLSQMEIAASLYEEHAAPDDPALYRTLNLLGEALSYEGRYAEAEAVFRSAAERAGRILGPDHRFTLEGRGQLGSMLISINRHHEAALILRDVLPRQARTLGGRAEETLSTKSILSWAEFALGRTDDAVAMMLDVLAEADAAGIADSSTALTCRQNLAVILWSEDRREEAVEHMRRAVDGWLRTHGDDHEGTVVTRTELAKWLMTTGSSDGVEELVVAAARSARRLYEPGHRHRISAEDRLRDWRRSQQRDDHERRP